MDQEQNSVNNVELNLPKSQKDLAQLLATVPGVQTREEIYPASSVLNRFQEAQNLMQKISDDTSTMKESDSVSGTTSQQTKSEMKNSQDSGNEQEKQCQKSSHSSTQTPNSNDQKTVHINFKRKICPEPYLLQMLESFKQESMITGNAFNMVLIDLLNLRRLCQAILLARQNGDQLDMEKLVDMLGIIL